MSERLEQIRGIENHIELLEAAQENREVLQKLMKIPEFNKIIDQLYLRDESIRLVRLKSSPHSQSAASQAIIMRDIDGIGSLYQFLHNVNMVGSTAREEIEEAKGQIEYLRSQED